MEEKVRTNVEEVLDLNSFPPKAFCPKCHKLLAGGKAKNQYGKRKQFELFEDHIEKCDRKNYCMSHNSCGVEKVSTFTNTPTQIFQLHKAELKDTRRKSGELLLKIPSPIIDITGTLNFV